MNPTRTSSHELIMDDATRRYLINPRIQSLGTPYVVDKEQVLTITAQLLDRNDLTGTLRETFDAYVGACMDYNMQRVQPPVIPAPMQCDNLLLPPKRLTTFVVRKKNLHLVHATAQPAAVRPPSASGEGDVPANVRRGSDKTSLQIDAKLA